MVSSKLSLHFWSLNVSLKLWSCLFDLLTSNVFLNISLWSSIYSLSSSNVSLNSGFDLTFELQLSFSRYNLQLYSYSLLPYFTEVKQFDAETKKYLNSIITSALAPLAISHAQKKLELRERHLQELADTLRGLDPEEVSCGFFLRCADVANEPLKARSNLIFAKSFYESPSHIN